MKLVSLAGEQIVFRMEALQQRWQQYSRLDSGRHYDQGLWRFIGMGRLVVTLV